MFKTIKSLVPNRIRHRIRKTRIAFMRARNGMRSIEDVFDAVYAKNEWGGAPGEIRSGSGSRGKAADLYIQLISSFVAQRGVKSIVDIGCGDFYIAERILDSIESSISYIGLDVARIVIETNTKRYARNGVIFLRADAATHELPAADLCLVRQVFQHLSNAQIAAIVAKFPLYKWAIVTEHYPSQTNFKAFNLDKVHGSDTRLYDGSAVYLDRPPFNLENITQLAEIEEDAGSHIRTWLIPTNASVR